MLLSLLLFATSVPGPQPSPPDWQPVHVWSDPAQALSGSAVRVFVNLEAPGYLLVLRRRPNGAIDVLFPASPGADPYTPEGTYEITGANGGAAFAAAETGSGILLAARSDAAFQTAEFVRGAEWDANALGGVSPDQDAEAAMTEIVQRMLGQESFNYDLTMYDVNAPDVEPEQPLATTAEPDAALLVYDVAPATPILPVAPVPVRRQLAPRHRAVNNTTTALAVYQGGQLSVTRPTPPARDQRPVALPTLPPIVIVQPRTHVHLDAPVAPASRPRAAGAVGGVAVAPRAWVVAVNPEANGGTAPRARGVATATAQAGTGGGGVAAVQGGVVAARSFAMPRVQFSSVALPGVVAIPRHR
ncbi:MAG TPA: hypothetical protein VLV45_11575 [Gemmatimonadales bacterium]|nr:hypothetical protein [Gemmatimonadales bacterium]